MNDLIGQTFNYLTVIGVEGSKCLCRCKCGVEKLVYPRSLVTNRHKSCGCRKIESIVRRSTKHGLCGTRFYKIWKDIRKRCYSPKTQYYYLYGGKGIKLCDEWLDPAKFVSWCEEQKPAEGASIDRINSNGNYEPINCRFADALTQARNTCTNIKVEYEGETYVLVELVKKLGVITPSGAYGRIRRGWSPLEAATTPRLKNYERKCTVVEDRLVPVEDVENAI
jgi:hypothetical protein